MTVTVDQDFVRVDDKSYAINKINSVEVRKKPVQGSRAYIFWWGLTALFVLSLFGARESDALLMLLGLTALFGFLGWVSFQKRADRVLYRLFLVTSSSEAAAVETYDRDEIDGLRGQIERAMAAR